MSGKESLVAALLLAIAVAGGALIPRLLASPPTSLGIALGPGPSRSVVQAPAIPRERHHAAARHAISPPSRAVAAPIAPVVPITVHPKPSAGVACQRRRRPSRTRQGSAEPGEGHAARAREHAAGPGEGSARTCRTQGAP